MIQALIKSKYDDATIAGVLLDLDNGISEKPRERGRRWVLQEIDRARRKAPVTKSNASNEGEPPNENFIVHRNIMVEMPSGPIKTLADEILTSDHFAQDAGRKLYRFHEGCYKADGAAYVKHRVKGLLQEWGQSAKWSSHRAEEVVEYLRVDAPFLWACPPLHRINVKNGLLDLETLELLEHSPDHLSSVQLPVAYDVRAQCPAWKKFVNQVFPKDTRKVAWEIVAQLMIPDTSIQRAILLEGPGGNGKSTYLQAIIAFLGRHNVASVSLHKLESDRFAVDRLVGRLANICPDLPSHHLVGTSIFKAITGGDLITAEYKYHDSFDFTPFARLVFSTNHLPRSGDDSPAFFDRWVVIPFTKSFRGTRQEVSRTILDARLCGPGELSGVLNRALAVLCQLRAHGFTISESMRRSWDEFRETTNPLAVWLGRMTVEHSEAMVTKGALLQAYNIDCERSGRPLMTKTAFGLAIRRLRPHLQDAQRTVEGRKQAWVWLGIGLKAI